MAEVMTQCTSYFIKPFVCANFWLINNMHISEEILTTSELMIKTDHDDRCNSCAVYH